MTAPAAPVSPMDPRLSLLIAAHDQTHHDLESLTDDVRANHQVLSDRVVRLEKELVSTGVRITAEVGLIGRKLDDIERNAAIVKEHVLLMTGKFGELDKKFTLLEENVTARIDAVDEKLTARVDAVDEKLTARIDAVDEKLSARLDTVDERFNAVDERFNAVDERFNAVDERFNAVDEWFNAVDERFNAVDERFNAVDERLDGIDARLDGIDERLDGIDARLETIVDLLTTAPGNSRDNDAL